MAWSWGCTPRYALLGPSDLTSVATRIDGPVCISFHLGNWLKVFGYLNEALSSVCASMYAWSGGCIEYIGCSARPFAYPPWRASKNGDFLRISIQSRESSSR